MRSGLVSLLRAEGTVTAIVAQRVYVTKLRRRRNYHL